MNLTDEEVSERSTQLQLPMNLGGFGYASLTATAPMQRLGALIRSLPFVEATLIRLKETTPVIHPEISALVQSFLEQLSDAEHELRQDLTKLAEWNSRRCSPTQEDLKSFGSLQSRLTRRLHEKASATWVASHPKENLDLHERLNSIIAPESGRVLNVATAYRPNHMNDLEFIYYVRRRLLLPAVNELRRCVDTDLEIDPHLDHAFCCIARGRGTTHTYVKNAVHQVATDVARYTGRRWRWSQISHSG
jgi:hypothetical protein